MNFKNKITRLLPLLLIFIMVFLVGCDEPVEDVSSPVTEAQEDSSSDDIGKNDIDINDEDTTSGTEGQENNLDSKVEINGNLEVHYIDVGQGDCILIKQGDSTMLIDAGDNKYGQTVVNYLKDNNISHLDYVIGTHPHADHIGGLDDVINTFSIGKVIMPKVNHTTKTFEDVVTAIKSKGLKITTPKVGDKYEIGQASFNILAPNGDSYSDLNDYSVINKLTFGNTSFMFTGDAEATAESEAVANGQNLKADVLKVGHHGSDTSTTESFLNAVDPKYAVIQVGTGNKYGHPTQSTLAKLEGKNIAVYRNDLNGNVIARSDGDKITFNTEPSKAVSVGSTPAPSKAATAVAVSAAASTREPQVIKEVPKEVVQEVSLESYIGNKNSKIFHRTTCSSLPNENNRVYFASKDEGISAGHRGCKKCNP